jgi:D-alanyl-D-alanine carboxypeptidase
VDIELDSVYRSVAKQQEIWDEFEEKYGDEYTKTYVATP